VNLSLLNFKKPEAPPVKNMTVVSKTNETIISAEIEKISSMGDVVIRFSSPMKTNVNLTDLAEVIEMYIVPFNDWTSHTQNFDMAHLNFTFNITEFKQDYMHIKLNFTDPYAISPLEQQDRLVWHVVDRKDFFISATELVELHANFTVLSGKIMKQMPDNAATNALLVGSEGSKDMMKGSMVTSVFMNVLLAGSLSHLLGMIKALQLVFHLPIMSTIAPANVISMWNIMIPIVMFDLLESIPYV
jgi:hypothetical protein